MKNNNSLQVNIITLTTLLDVLKSQVTQISCRSLFMGLWKGIHTIMCGKCLSQSLPTTKCTINIVSVNMNIAPK